MQPWRTEEAKKRGAENRKAMEEIRKSSVDEVSKDVSRAFLEIWAYLDGFKNTEDPMSYKMVKEIFGSIDRDKLVDVFKHAGRR